MHAVILLLLQSRKFGWYLLLTSSMLLYDVASDTQCLVTTCVPAGSAAAQRAAHVQQLNCSVKKRQSFLLPICVASKQPKSQSSGLRDLGCYAASCLPQTNPVIRTAIAKNRRFHVPHPTFFVSPGDAPAITTQYVAWMERQFNACQTPRSTYHVSSTVS